MTDAATMLHGLVLLVGALLVTLGTTLPAHLRGDAQRVVQVRVGRDHPLAQRLGTDLPAGVPDGVAVERTSPHVFTFRAPPPREGDMLAFATQLASPRDAALPPPACDVAQPGCALLRLEHLAAEAAPPAVLDPPGNERPAPGRAAWLLGMAVMLAGLACCAWALRGGVFARPGVRGLLAAGAACGVMGAGAGAWLSGVLEQDVRVVVPRPVQRPSDGTAWEPWFAAEDARARLGGAPLREPLEVDVHAISAGMEVRVTLRAETPGALAAWVARARDRVHAWDVQQAERAQQEMDLLAQAPDPVVAALAARHIRAFSVPEFHASPVRHAGHGPLGVGAGCALAGALVAATATRRRQRPGA